MRDAIRTYFRALINRLVFGQKPAPSASAIIESTGGAIDDGMTYAMPQLLPGHTKTELKKIGALEAYLKESAQASYRSTYNFPFDAPSVRDQNFAGVYEDPLQEWDQRTREFVLSNTHAAVQRNPLGKRCVHYISSFVVGTGFNLHCQNKDVEKALQDFIDHPENLIREYERTAVRDLVVDGELFLRFFSGTDKATRGQVIAVPYRPWEIKWIRTDPGFFRRIIEYHWQQYAQPNRDDPNAITEQNTENIPAAEMMHVAINKHAYELRGRPEMYPALPWLKAHRDWLENRARQNHHRGSLLWWVKLLKAAPSVVAAKIAQYSRPITPGSVAVTTENEEWSALSNPVGANDAGEDGRQLKIMAQNGIGGIPEYMTGDGENANLATSKSQQLPVLTTFREFQVIMIEQVWTPMFKRVIQAQIDAGLLPEMVEVQDSEGDPILQPDDDADPEWEEMPTPPVIAGQDEPQQEAEGEAQGDMQDNAPRAAGAVPVRMIPKPPAEKKVPKIRAIDAFDVDYEPLNDDDPKNLADALDIAVGHEWVSNEEAATRMGFDYSIERKKIEREKRAKMVRQARGEEPQAPSFIPPGFGGGNPFEQERTPDASQ